MVKRYRTRQPDKRAFFKVPLGPSPCLKIATLGVRKSVLEGFSLWHVAPCRVKEEWRGATLGTLPPASEGNGDGVCFAKTTALAGQVSGDKAEP